MTNQNRYATGWMIFVAALGVAMIEIGQLLEGLNGWDEASTPAIAGKIIVRLGVVIGAFVGGKLIPTPGDRRLRDKRVPLEKRRQ